MSQTISNHSHIATRLWFWTSVSLTLGAGIYQAWTDTFFSAEILFAVPFFIITSIGSLPALLILWYRVEHIKKLSTSFSRKITLLCLSCLLITAAYGLLAGSFSFLVSGTIRQALQFAALITGALFSASLVAILIIHQSLIFSFSDNASSFQHQSNTTNMQQDNSSETQPAPAFQASSSYWDQKPMNRTLIKAGITGVLILLMLIPVSYIQSLIGERKERQEQIITEVSSKWAASQTVTPLYLVIPYKTGDTAADKKEVVRQLIILPEQVSVKGDIEPEKRHRSNYDVLLYRSRLNMNGEFHLSLPQNIKTDQLLLSEAKVCTGISDFKGIEKKVVVRLGSNDITLSPGLPVDMDSNGLSAPAVIIPEQLTASIPFSLSLSLKGSSQLHFKPMSGNSSFELNSTWPHPSFDGNVIPVRDENEALADSSFPARWNFSNANLPFTTTLQGNAIKSYDDLAFGVSLIQPVDQYAKSMRSIKYAILVIGLTFSLFFIIEMVQRNPVHPVQYVLVGLALVIFYSLLISFSEYIPFNWAYLIAATATVILITLYTKSHFRNWKTAGIFFAVLSGLYGFIYTLISLEDTALLAGSIALFVVLAVAMYASRKINWYGASLPQTDTQFSSPV